MNKIILKTALKTVLAVIVISVAVFAVICFGFPQNMASLFERSGNYSAATEFATLRYHYTKDVDDLARCVEDCSHTKNSARTVKYGVLLLENSGFEDLCKEKDEYYSKLEYSALTVSYKQYICGKISIAYYKTGNFSEAVKTAKIANADETQFSSGNALAALAVEVINAKDKPNGELLSTELSAYHPENAEYLNDVLSALNKMMNS